MDKPTASVDIIPPISGGEYTLNLSALTTAGFSVQGEFTKETAWRIRREIDLALQEIEHRKLNTTELVKAEVRRQAHLRDDHFVGPHRVLCAHDHCCDTRNRDGDTHPWDLAIADGWKPLWAGTDLLCADCVGPKEFCPF